MSTFTIEVKIPDSLRELGYSDEEICREVPTLLVLKRYREGLVSSGKDGRILGLSRRHFLDLHAKERLPIYGPSDADLATEFETAQWLGGGEP
jgi:predicted HTH domain antitoxin